MAYLPKKKKDPFEDLEETFKDEVDKLTTVDELKQKFAEVAKGEESNQAAKKADPDLNKAKEDVKNASLGYNEVSKKNKLRTRYLIERLADRGDLIAQGIVQNRLSAEAQKA